MKATVDAAICIGCGLCTNICPEVFEMNGDIAVVKGGLSPENAEASCKEAADSCPVTAIQIQD